MLLVTPCTTCTVSVPIEHYRLYMVLLRTIWESWKVDGSLLVLRFPLSQLMAGLILVKFLERAIKPEIWERKSPWDIHYAKYKVCYNVLQQRCRYTYFCPVHLYVHLSEQLNLWKIAKIFGKNHNRSDLTVENFVLPCKWCRSRSHGFRIYSLHHLFCEFVAKSVSGNLIS